jgi:hypothetical protein
MSTPHNFPGMGKRTLHLIIKDGVFQPIPEFTDEDKAKYTELHDKMIEDLQKLIIEKDLITGTKGEL